MLNFFFFAAVSKGQYLIKLLPGLVAYACNLVDFGLKWEDPEFKELARLSLKNNFLKCWFKSLVKIIWLKKKSIAF